MTRGLPVAVLVLAFALVSHAELMRVVAPVRLASEKGAELESEVAKTRQVLERFQKSGFEYTVWAVDKLPAKDEDIAPWVEACLKAFPGKIILAIDSRIENGSITPAPARLDAFLKALLAPSTPHLPPSFHSVLLNFSKLNNYQCRTDEAAAVDAVRRTAEQVRAVAPDTPRWLLLDDNPTVADRISAWVDGVDALAGGYYLQRRHGPNATGDESFQRLTQSLLGSRKPVLRAGFAYSAPRVRPGIEEDLLDQYRSRMTRYERWVESSGYKGYVRTIGEAVPNAVSLNLDYLADTGK
jgi:hypothetical protein